MDTMALSLDKVADQAPELLASATKTRDALAAHDLSTLTSEVALVLDFSFSMSELYRSGAVQELVNKTLAVATQLDDDGEIDLYLFHSTAEYVGRVNVGNFRDVVAQVTKGKSMGGTHYGNAIRCVVDQLNYDGGGRKKRSLFGKKPSAAAMAPLPAPVPTPALALFITDGETQEQPSAVHELVSASYRPIFWQFLSIGPNIPFLQRLDDLDGRYIDNADYKNVSKLSDLQDDDVIAMVLDEYPSWVEEERKRGQIA